MRRIFQKTKFQTLLSAVTLITLLVVTSSAEARFEYVTRADGQRVVKTYAKKGEGLASIVRDLGLEPNWQDQSWITNIQQANPSLINSSNNFVATPESPLTIPVDGLTMLKGHPQLESQFVVPAAEPATMVIETEIIPEPQPVALVPVVETPVDNSSDRASADVDLSIGYGFSNLVAKRSTLVDTSLNSDLNVYGNFNLGFDLTEIQRVTIFATGRLVKYSPPSTISLLQDNPFLFDLGFSYGFRLGGETYLSLVATAQKQHMARFNFTNIEVLAPTVYSVGGQLRGPLLSFTNSTLSYTLTPQYLLAMTDILQVQEGYQVALRLQLQPYNGHSGWIFGGEYIYRVQDDSLSQQSYQTAVGYLGYRF